MILPLIVLIDSIINEPHIEITSIENYYECYLL